MLENSYRNYIIIECKALFQWNVISCFLFFFLIKPFWVLNRTHQIIELFRKCWNYFIDLWKNKHPKIATNFCMILTQSSLSLPLQNHSPNDQLSIIVRFISIFFAVVSFYGVFAHCAHLLVSVSKVLRLQAPRHSRSESISMLMLKARKMRNFLQILNMFTINKKWSFQSFVSR